MMAMITVQDGIPDEMHFKSLADAAMYAQEEADRTGKPVFLDVLHNGKHVSGSYMPIRDMSQV